MIGRGAQYESDDRDDEDRGVLNVFFAGNGDWYAAMNWAVPNGRTMGPAVRFCTSGGLHPHAAILAVAILHDIGVGKLEDALHRAKALVEALEPKERGIESRWPPEPAGPGECAGCGKHVTARYPGNLCGICGL